MLIENCPASSCSTRTSDDPEIASDSAGVLSALTTMSPDPDAASAVRRITSTVTSSFWRGRTDSPGFNSMRSVLASPLPSSVVCTSGTRLSSPLTCTPSRSPWRTTMSMPPRSAMAE